MKAETGELKQMITKAAMQLVKLKQVNREAQFAAETLKNSGQHSKLQVDKLNPQLQNLFYEKSHIKKEITHCKAFVYVVCMFLA